MKDIKEAESENKADDEDYLKIDARFNEEFAQIDSAIDKWDTHVVDKKNKDEVEAHFNGTVDKFKELREYINNYTFVIPSTLFSQY